MKPQIVENPTDEQFAVVHKGLRDHNSRFVTNSLTRVRAAIKQDSGQVIAGVDGLVYWGKLHIHTLWVHPDHRSAGMGSRLMRWAEERARALGCNSIVLDTATFQALQFYLKLGYRQFGVLEGYENGHKRHYLRKAIEPANIVAKA